MTFQVASVTNCLHQRGASPARATGNRRRRRVHPTQGHRATSEAPQERRSVRDVHVHGPSCHLATRTTRTTPRISVSCWVSWVSLGKRTDEERTHLLNTGERQSGRSPNEKYWANQCEPGWRGHEPGRYPPCVRFLANRSGTAWWGRRAGRRAGVPDRRCQGR